MGFDVVKFRNRYNRYQLNFADQEVLSKCETCTEKKAGFCDGFTVESDDRYCNYDCERCIAYCCKSDWGWGFLEDVGGSDISGIAWDEWGLHWPKVIYSANSDMWNADIEFINVSVKKLLSLRTGKWSKQKNLRKRFNIPKGSFMSISFFANDEYLERMWLNGLKKSCQEVAKYKPDFVFAVNFSTYDNWPVLMNRANIRRKWLSVEYFQQENVKVIPDIGFCTDLDLRRNAAHVNRENIDAISYCFMRNKEVASVASWQSRFDDLEEFLERAGCVKKVFVSGCTGIRRLYQLLKRFGDLVTVIDTKIYRLAEYKKNWLGVQNKEKSYQENFLDSKGQIERFYDFAVYGKELPECDAIAFEKVKNMIDFEV